LLTYGWWLVADYIKSRNTTAAAKQSSKLAFVTIFTLPTVIGLLFLWAVSSLTLPDVSKATEPLALERGGVRMQGGQSVTNLVREVQKRAPSSSSILSLPYQPLLYFLAERRNPTRWNYIWKGDQTPQDYESLIQETKKDLPAVVVLFGEDEMSSYASTIVDYIHQDYDLAADIGGITVYFPR
jgi:hypothetical protein